MKSSLSRLLVGVGLIVATLAVFSFAVLRPTGGAASAQQSYQTITIKASDLRFDKNTITVKVGQPVTIRLENDDGMDHAFSIDALGVHSGTAGPNKSVSVTFTPQKVGTYEFLCLMPGHAILGMVGTFEVVP